MPFDNTLEQPLLLSKTIPRACARFFIGERDTSHFRPFRKLKSSHIPTYAIRASNTYQGTNLRHWGSFHVGESRTQVIPRSDTVGS